MFTLTHSHKQTCVLFVYLYENSHKLLLAQDHNENGKRQNCGGINWCVFWCPVGMLYALKGYCQLLYKCGKGGIFDGNLLGCFTFYFIKKIWLYDFFTIYTLLISLSILFLKKFHYLHF